MAYHQRKESPSQSKTLSKEDRQYQILTAQLYGKQTVVKAPSANLSAEKDNKTAVNPEYNSIHQHSSTDLVYLKKDLIKIGLLTTSAVIIQILLFLSINKGLIKI